MSDVQPTGSTYQIPGTSFNVPGLDTFVDFVAKVNQALNNIATGLGANVSDLNNRVAASATSTDVKGLADTLTSQVAAATDTAKSDLQIAVNDLSAKFTTAQTSFQPTPSAPPPPSYGWLWIVGGFIVAWLIAEKKFPS